MHGRERSAPAIVARKSANVAGRPAAEPVERRAGAEGNADQRRTRRAQDRASVSQALGPGRGERAPGAGPRATSREAEEGGTVHRALPPPQPGPAPGGVPRAQARRRPRRGRADLADLRGGPRSPDRGAARAGPPGAYRAL